MAEVRAGRLSSLQGTTGRGGGKYPPLRGTARAPPPGGDGGLAGLGVTQLPCPPLLGPHWLAPKWEDRSCQLPPPHTPATCPVPEANREEPASQPGRAHNFAASGRARAGVQGSSCRRQETGEFACPPLCGGGGGAGGGFPGVWEAVAEEPAAARAASLSGAPAVQPSAVGEAGARADPTAPPRPRAVFAGPPRVRGPECGRPRSAPHFPSPSPSPCRRRGASGGCSRAPLATSSGKTLASPEPRLKALSDGQRRRSPRERMARGSAEPPAPTPRACPALGSCLAERPALPTAARVPGAHWHLQRVLQGDEQPIRTGQRGRRPRGIRPSWVQQASQNFFCSLGSPTPEPLEKFSRAPGISFPGDLRGGAGTRVVGSGVKRRCSRGLRSAAGPIHRKACQASIPAPSAGLLVPKGFQRPRGCLGFSLREGGRRERRGDFNFVVSNENALCKQIAEAASVGEVG